MKYFTITLLLFISYLTHAQDWEIQSEGLSKTLYDIHFVDENKGWSCGYDILLKTVDGGQNWSSLNLPDDLYSWNKVYFADENNGWLVGGRHTSTWIGKIYKTTDGGNSWNLKYTSNSARFEDAYFINENEVIVIGIGDSPEGVVYKTTDGGISWQEKYTHDSMLIAVNFYDENIGWIVGINTVLYTENAGETWQVKVAPSVAFITDIHIIDAQTAFVSDGLGAIYKTTNTGQDWTMTSVSSSELNNLHFIDNQAITIGDWGEFFTSNDFGETWEEGDFETGHLYKIYFYNDHLGWIVGSDGTILHSETGILTNDDDSKIEKIKIYPNPVQDSFYLSNEITVLGVEIFNIYGKIIKKLKLSETGKYNISDIESGVYFIRVLLPKGYTYTRLIKN